MRYTTRPWRYSASKVRYPAPKARYPGPNRRGYIAQWLERLTADQQVPGSNPGVPSFNHCGADEDLLGNRNWLCFYDALGT